ncbi:Gp37-like protein [Arthrobacter sp. MDT1-65]
MSERLRITVFDKSFGRRGWLGNPESVTVTTGFNVVGSAEVTFAADHPRAADILAEGARLVIDLEGLSYPLISGPVRSVTGSGPNAQSMLTVTVEDDLRLLWRVLGWQVPTAAIGAQNTAEYRTYTGNAESIVKDMVTEQAKTRLGLPVTVAPNLNRGAVIPGGVKIRMHPLADRLFPAVEQAGLGVRCYQSGAGLVLDVYEPATYPRKISEQAGTLRSWEFSSAAPTATRVVGGGSGEATARTFRSAANPSLEALYGDVVEVFADARNGDTVDELNQSNSEVLFDSQPTSGLSVELSETPHFRYGVAVAVGDRVTIQAGGTTITDVLRSVTISWNRAEGLSIQPSIGKVENSSDAKIAKAIKALWKGLTIQKTR